MGKRIIHLVADSGAFIKCFPMHEYAETVYTVRGAVKEIKDRATLERLQFLPYTLHVKEPSQEACRYVLNFSKKTGDYANLSLVDLQILALTYQLETENIGVEHIRKEPSCSVTAVPLLIDDKINGFYIPKEDQEKSSDETDEESWLTSSNIGEIQKEMDALKLDCSITVACVTTDFCIQNVLKQMGLNVLSVDGLQIKQMHVFILRCFSCYKTTNNIEKQFCPNCGNKTLKRVAVTVDENGSKNIHINFRRPINIRGTRYSLPMPRGGKHSVDPVLFEDQRLPQNRPKKSKKVDMMSEDYVAGASPFSTNDVFSRAAHLGIRCNKNHQKKNPNEWSKRTGNKK